MKIYTKIVLNMDSGEVLEEYSYEHSGLIWACKTKVEAPEPSAEERELQTLQVDLARRQAEQQEAIEPFILQSQGLIKDPETGEIRELTPEELTAGRTPTEQRQFDITKESQERQLKALRGELEVSPALEREIAEREKRTREVLSRRLGPGFETTTGGQQGLARLAESSGLLREEARRGQITSGQAILQSRLSGLLGQQGQQFGQFQGIGQGGLGLIGGLGQAQQGFQFNRQMQFDAASQTAANRAGLISSALGAVGTGLGLAATGGLSGLFPKKPPQLQVG